MLSQSEEQVSIDILNDHGLEQLIHFPTLKENTLELIITPTSGQFQDIHSPDKLSDHEIVAGNRKNFHPSQDANLGGRFTCIKKGDYNSMRKDPLNFANEKYFNGHSNSRREKERWQWSGGI